MKYASLDNLICSVCHNFANPKTAAVSVVWPAYAYSYYMNLTQILLCDCCDYIFIVS